MNTRQQLTEDDLANALETVARKLRYRMSQKGLGTMASRHEIYGVLAEEMHELMLEIHGKDKGDGLIRELTDIAVGCIFGIASIENKGVDW